jgi:hypothetical protein
MYRGVLAASQKRARALETNANQDRLFGDLR